MLVGGLLLQIISVTKMNNETVRELKAITKKQHLRGYYKLGRLI